MLLGEYLFLALFIASSGAGSEISRAADRCPPSRVPPPLGLRGRRAFLSQPGLVLLRLPRPSPQAPWLVPSCQAFYCPATEGTRCERQGCEPPSGGPFCLLSFVGDKGLTWAWVTQALYFFHCLSSVKDV